MTRANGKILLVSGSNVSGHAPLPNTRQELETITRLAPPEQLLNPSAPSHVDTASLGDSTVDRTLPQLVNASIVHFACHGIQDRTNPLESGFIIQDGRLRLSQLMDLNLPSAYFAFLSACNSAAGDRAQPDEAVHLAAAMMYIGFQSVVGTMWYVRPLYVQESMLTIRRRTMHDADGPHVAETVYRSLFKERRLNMDVDAIPYALDQAVQELRDKGFSPGRWATYMHMGI